MTKCIDIPKKLQGFTLIEMLVVIAIIALLASMIIPAVSKSLESAQRMKCVSNLRNILLASRMYAIEHNDIMVPSKYTSASGSKEFWNSALLEIYNEKENETLTREKFSCTKWEKVGANYTNWNWGYAINDTPGYDEDDSKPNRKNTRVTREPDGTFSGTYFYLSSITKPSSRLFYCCANQWHVNFNNVEEFPDFDRHGNGKCNVAFFDGHVANLTEDEILESVRNP